MARDELFELAVNRALSYAQRLALDFTSDARLTAGLEVWYLKTRFAYRVPLSDVVAVLLAHPDPGAMNLTWRGGVDGAWREHA